MIPIYYVKTTMVVEKHTIEILLLLYLTTIYIQQDHNSKLLYLYKLTILAAFHTIDHSVILKKLDYYYIRGN